MKIIIMILLLLTTYNLAQTDPYSIPFASKDNSIDLTIANSSEIVLKDVKVKITSVPEWIKFTSDEVNITELKGKEEKDASFTFDVNKTAPVGKEGNITFMITGQTGESWTKEIRISVSAPKEYKLFQNYPNPFNPSTTISYELSKQSKVSLKIYNTLGEEVTTLMDNIQEAGYYEPRWNATSQASGMYICQLFAKGTDGEEFVQRRKMLLIK